MKFTGSCKVSDDTTLTLSYSFPNHFDVQQCKDYFAYWLALHEIEYKQETIHVKRDWLEKQPGKIIRDSLGVIIEE